MLCMRKIMGGYYNTISVTRKACYKIISEINDANQINLAYKILRGEKAKTHESEGKLIEMIMSPNRRKSGLLPERGGYVTAGAVLLLSEYYHAPAGWCPLPPAEKAPGWRA